MGKCGGCGGWNTFVEEVVTVQSASPKGISSVGKPILLKDIDFKTEPRIKVGIPEFDRVLGGGLVLGSLVLVGGDPGIGKSTLLLQATHSLEGKQTVLYISGEESVEQIKMRAQRLGVEQEQLYLVGETNIEMILSYVDTLKPDVVIIDSIQTVYSTDLPSAPGSVGQVRESTARLMHKAKGSNTTFLLVGHVTKEGSIAGPRVLEHMVDTVLYLEGDRHHSFRILRGVKNRFGSTNEIGVFEMREGGLIQVDNPSEIFLAERPKEASGSIVTATMEGTRPLLLEIQALVSPTVFGNPRRLATGLDFNRILLMIAVLEKKVGFVLNNQDVYLNVAGGVKIDEPACDLAICMALVSNLRNQPLDYQTLVLGEVGLTGEVRGVSQIEKRIIEGAKLGFTQFIVPNNNLKNLNINVKDVQIKGVSTVYEGINLVF
jgi:DNA repair protein RadA/Sms